MIGVDDEVIPPWEDESQSGVKDESQSPGSEDKSENSPDGAAPQEEIVNPFAGPIDPLLDYSPETGDDGEYRDFGECRSACAYLDRIGAKWSSMNTAVVETGVDQDGYRAPRGTIKFLFCGHVTITPDLPELAPTDEERTAIFEEAQWCSLIKPAEIVPADLLAAASTPWEIKKAIEENRLFAFYDAQTGRCTMVQERVEETAKHKKYFVPWTLWSDGRWLKRAAGGPFPFWGMDTLRAAPEGVKVFIHEGAKSAHFAANLPTDHPWVDELKAGAVHLGWISGARTPRNNDWTGLAKVLERLKVECVVIVADNDQDGLKALLPIAKEIHAPTFAIRFPPAWAKGFDIADRFPADCWKPDLKGKPRYKGPSFLDCLTACTWPTDTVYGAPPPPVKGKKTKVVVNPEDRDGTEEAEKARCKMAPLFRKLRPAFGTQWGYIDAMQQFVNRVIPTISLSGNAFDCALRPFARECKSLSGLLLPELELHYGLTAYRPGQPEIIGEQGVRLLNCYRPTNIKRIPGGDVSFFLEFAEYLIPIKWDRDEFLRWIATIIAHPERRLTYGVLGISEKQGVGKDTLAIIIKMCIGFRNCSNPSASHIITSQFDEWRVNKLLVVISEIYEGENWTAYNKLKSLFTEKSKNSNLKYIGSHELDCCNLFLMFSNSLRCLKIDNSDRRLLIPRITETPWPRQKFREFYDWLYNQDGFGCVLDWAHTFETKYGGEYVLEGDDAPMTEFERQPDRNLPQPR